MPTSAPHGARWSQPWRDIASPALSEELARIGTPRTLADGQLLYARGDRSRELYGVQSGLIRVVVIGPEGTESLLGLYAPGTWFGEVSLFDEGPRPVSTYAVGHTELLVVSSDTLREMLRQHPHWYQDFARVLCNKLRLTLAHIESETLPIGVRITLRLLDLAQAYGRHENTGVVIGLKLPQEDLARMLRLTRQSINKALRTLEDRGWLRIRRGQITLLDLPALRASVRDGGGETLLLP